MLDPKGGHERLKVFVSYSRADLEFADQLVKGLDLCGFEPTIDRTELRSGEAFRQRLMTLIREAVSVVFVLSPHSAASPDCAWEVDEAVRFQKRILPVVCKSLDGCSTTERLAGLQWTYFYADPKFPGSGFGDGLAKLVQVLNTDLDWVGEHTHLQQQATYWEQGNKPPDRLLKGADITAAKDWLKRQPRGAPPPTELHLEFINTSEQEELHRLSTERQRLADMAAAQDRERMAIAAEKAAVEQAEREQRARLQLRNGAIAVLVAVSVLVLWLLWKAVDAKNQAEDAETKTNAALKTAQTEREAALAAQGRAVEASQEADHQRQQAITIQRRLLAATAERAVESGDAIKGALIALEAIPEGPAANDVPDDLRLSLYRAINSLRERRVVPLASRAEFSGDGRRILTTHNGKVARLFDVDSGQQVGLLEGHTNVIRQAIFSPDQRQILTTASDRTIRLWDAENFGLIKTIQLNQFAQAAAFDPTGRIIALAVEKEVQIWDRATGERLFVLDGHAGDVLDLSFSPDGRSLVSASWDNKAIVWDVSAGRPRFSLTGHKDWVRSAAFSADGRLIVTASDDYTADVWDAQNGQNTIQLKGHKNSVNWAAFSPDGKTIATISRDGTARLWSAATGALAQTLAGHQRSITCGRFSADGRYLATGSEDHTARVWEVATGRLVTTLAGHVGGITTVAFNNDGQLLLSASVSDGTARVWDISPAPGSTLDNIHEQLKSAEFNRDGSRILIATVSNRFALVNSQTGTSIDAPIIREAAARNVGFLPNGLRIGVFKPDGSVSIADAMTGQSVATLSGAPAELGSFMWSGNGRRVVTRSIDNRIVQLWNSETGQFIRRLEGFSEPVENWNSSHNGQRFYTRAKGLFYLYDNNNGQLLRKLGKAGSQINRAALWPDGRRIIDVSYTLEGSARAYTASLWNTETGEGKQLVGPVEVAPAFAVSPNGKYIAIWGARLNGIQLWNSETMEPAANRPFIARDASLSNIVFSPDSVAMAAAASDRSVRVWNIPTGSGRLVLRHDDRVSGIAFSPDNKWIATASRDTTARLWERGSGNLKYSLNGHRAPVTHVTFSRDNRWVVTRSEDNTALLWDVVTGHRAAMLPMVRNAMPTVSPSGKMAIAAVDDRIFEVWPIFETVQQLAEYARAKVVRCLNAQQRLELGFKTDPPPWCAGAQVQKWPYDPAGKIGQGNAYLSRSEHERAISVYLEALAQNPKLQPDVASALAISYERLARQIADEVFATDEGPGTTKLATALQYIQKALDQQEPSSDLFITQGIVSIGMGKLQEAQALFAKAFDQGARVARLYLARGIASEKLGQRALAAADFGEAQKRATDEFYRDQATNRLEAMEKRTPGTD